MLHAKARVAIVTNNGNSDNIWAVVLVTDRCNFGARRTNGTLLAAVSDLFHNRQ